MMFNVMSTLFMSIFLTGVMVLNIVLNVRFKNDNFSEMLNTTPNASDMHLGNAHAKAQAGVVAGPQKKPA